MAYKKFYIGLIIRLFAFGILCVVIGIMGLQAQFIHSFILFAILITAIILELLRYLNYTNRYMANYFSSLIESGSLLNFNNSNKEESFRKLTQSMGKVWNLLTEARLKNEEEQQFLSNLIEHIGTGVVAFNQDGKTRLYNPTALRIFNLQHLTHWAQLGEIDPTLMNRIKQSEDSNKLFIKCVINEEIKELILYISVFKLRRERIRLISIQDINDELSKKEVLAWHQVINVMTHEIMSSISPITSLTKHIKHKLNPNGDIIKASKIDQNLVEDMVESLEIMNQRGEGLIDFVDKYRSIAYLPEPKFEKTNLNDLLSTLCRLSEVEFKECKIIQSLGKIKKVNLDRNLTEQALLNLIRNSAQALENSDKKEIVLKTYEYPKGVCLEIYDYGKGISNEIKNKVFIPFFSTKNKGTGIGLSFARQVVHLHGGEININSSPEEWTRVKLFFPFNL